MKRILSFALLASMVAPGAALAHTGVGATHGLVRGLMHPVGGLDHVLAMVAVGVLAAIVGGRAFWLIPASFVAMAAAGGLVGASHLALPYVEIGIAVSVIVLGLVVALRAKLPTALAMAMVGLFGLYHGFAHGAEMPADTSGLAYGLGFLAATIALHAGGIGLGLGINSLGARPAARLAQAGGAVMAVAGVALLIGA
ncbi:MAG: HupE/UreJ family protein [Xanthobacteraceae bacterium]